MTTRRGASGTTTPKFMLPNGRNGYTSSISASSGSSIRGWTAIVLVVVFVGALVYSFAPLEAASRPIRTVAVSMEELVSMEESEKPRVMIKAAVEEKEDVSETRTTATGLSSVEPQYPVYETEATVLDQVQNEISPDDIPEPVEDKGHTVEEIRERDKRAEIHDDDIFQDPEEYRKAPIIQSMPESSSLRYREIVLQHERYYRNHQSRLYVPRLKNTARLTVEEFSERFIKTSQPVIVPFDAMRHLGFQTKSYTLDELLEMYPNYKRTFVYRYGNPGKGEMDLGPAVWALKQGDALRKTANGRNFPRNMKISLDKLSKLGIQHPPYVLPDTPMLLPSLWFGAVTSSTKMHSDCCDNYAIMISGTKRWVLAPPHEARILTPVCQGGLCWVKKLEHADEHATGAKQLELLEKLQRVQFELRPNEMLYLVSSDCHTIPYKVHTGTNMHTTALRMVSSCGKRWSNNYDQLLDQGWSWLSTIH